MFENKIVFRALNEYIEWSDVKPEPVSVNVPEWYKKLEHKIGNFTVKGCLPFMDTLTTGYILKTPQDYYVDMKPKENPENDEVTVGMIVETMAKEFPEFLMAVAEENWIRGYHQALEDVNEGERIARHNNSEVKEGE